jgi:hypothetical protein
MARVQEVVKGAVTPLTSLGDLTDAQALQKASFVLILLCTTCHLMTTHVRKYTTHDRRSKRSNLLPVQMHKVTAEELRIGSLADAIVCRMAARDAG